MTDLKKVFSYLNTYIYNQNNLVLSNISKENFNIDYGAHQFSIDSHTYRFRISKITPKKTGQFVAIWEKDSNNKNTPFLYETFPDFLIITSMDNDNIGQFIFPKALLLEQNILKTETTKGKMAFRVYPPWDNPTSKQGLSSQKWQVKYFIDINNYNYEKLINLYTKKDTFP